MADLETLLAEVIRLHEMRGVLPAAAEIDRLAGGDADLAARLSAVVQGYAALSSSLDTGDVEGTDVTRSPGSDALPTFDGFRTIERIGGGGMGEVYKLQDLMLGRNVAAKVIRRQGAAARVTASDFLREARSMALFSDPRIVRIFECRADAAGVVIIMEFVDGFELGRLTPSLEFRQRAAIMRELCDALQHAHALGIQHRDLKPSNIMIDGALSPKILDFGLSGRDETRGHLQGTFPYIAPEQLDPSQPIDARADIYALGVIFYELLCGSAPCSGSTTDFLRAVPSGQCRLPIEIDGRVPDALQAIALKAMERRPVDRYQTAREMARDIARYLDGLPVTARPTLYAATLASRVAPHLDQVAEWLRLRLLYPHEAERITSAYRSLTAREDDWIVASRALTPSQIVLYLGAFFLFVGALFYFVAHRYYNAVNGLTGPVLILGVPFASLNIAGRWLYERRHQAVAVAFYLAGLSLLPLFLLIVLQETGWWAAAAGDTTQLLGDAVSNRQLQVTAALSCAWSVWLALRTRTSALSIISSILLFFMSIAGLADVGLRTWLESGRFDLLSLHLAPLAAVYCVAGWWLERSGRPWFAAPTFFAAVATVVVVMDLWAIDGKLLHYVGITLRHFQPPAADNPALLDMLAALSLNGLLFYGMATMLERLGRHTLSTAVVLLFTIAPFSILEPLAFLTRTGIYHQRFDWLYLGLAIGIALVSYQRQRKSFYYAGVLNAGLALVLIADRHQWFGRPAWAITIVVTGVATLGAGFVLEARRRRAR